MNVDQFSRILRADGEADAQVPVDRIRRLARWIRIRRMTGTTVAAVVAAMVATTLVVDLPGRGTGQPAGVSPGAAVDCPSGTVPPVSQADATSIDTGVVAQASDGTRYHVILGLEHWSTDAGLTVFFRDATGVLADTGDSVEIGPHVGGDFSGKHSADPTHQFLSVQLPLGPHSVLDMGIFSRSAARIAVVSAGRSTDAHLRALSEGWTLFWAKRDAAPLPAGAKTTATPYQGPEQVKLTAYAADGTVEHTVDGADPDAGRFVGSTVPIPVRSTPGRSQGPKTSECQQPTPNGS